MKRQGLRLPLAGSLALALILAAGFMARWSIADQQSYWLDELLSVDTYGVGNKSLGDAIKRLAASSIHPPLYQSILYGWMKLFGDVEPTTRMLSNVYVTLAGLFLYLAARRPMGERRALFATLLFSFMYVPVRYSVETRSYGQSLFLSTLSTWALFDWLRLLSKEHSWRNALGSRPAVSMMAASFLLLMTHYYNVFFLAMQGVFVVGWTLRRSWDRGAPRKLARVTTALLLPLLTQLAVWGPAMAKSYKKRSEQFLATEDMEGPFAAFWRYALGNAIGNVTAAVLTVLSVLALVFFAKEIALARRSRSVRPADRATFLTYALATSIGTFFVAWALFVASGHARYSNRYFSYTAPAIAVLLVCTLEQLITPIVHGAPGFFSRLRGRTVLARGYLRWSALFAVLSLGLVLPSTYDVIAKPKADWRGTGKQVAELIKADARHRYVVFSSNFTRYPSLDYYFKRYGSKAKVAHYFGRDSNKPFSAKTLQSLRGKNYLVVTFTHLKAEEYDKLLPDLDQRFERSKTALRDGVGYIVYRIDEAKLPPAPKKGKRKG